MNITTRQPTQLVDGGYLMATIALEDIRVGNYALMAIDGSTTNTGVAIMRESDGALMYTLAFTRDKKKETPVEYKVRLKRAIRDILLRNKYICQIYYEEPTIANKSAIANLFMLKTFVEEIIVEDPENFNHIKHYQVNNMRWKKEFLRPDKVPQGTEKQKAAVRQKMETYLPFLIAVTEDEIDAAALGFVAARFSIMDSADDLKTKKKPRQFKYNAMFVGSDSDEALENELLDVYNGPMELLENGIDISEIDSKTDFNKHIYDKMGHDDKVLIIKFSSKHHGNIILEHRIGNLAAQFEFIYAVIWRKTRKY